MGQKLTERMRFKSEYDALKNAIHRCHNPNHHAYKDYGQRGIKVQDLLRTNDGWKLLIETIGPKPEPHFTLDRINNDGDYSIEPLNLRWTDRKTQQNNRREEKTPTEDFGFGLGTRANATGRGAGTLSPLLAYQGRIQTLAEWAVERNLHSATIRQRLRRGLSVEEALTQSTSRKGQTRSPKNQHLISLTIH